MELKNQIKLYTLLVVSILLVSVGYSQNKFFICPELSFKTSIAFVNPANMSNNEHKIFENQSFYKPYAIANSARVVKHQFAVYGLSAGITYKESSRFLKISYNKDIAGFRVYSFYRPYNSPSFLGNYTNYLGIGFHRLMIDYGLKISSKSTIFQTWFTIGAGININRNRGSQITEGHRNIILNSGGDELLRVYTKSFEENRTNACLKVGFDSDLYLKNKYIATFNIHYIQGFGVISRIEYVHEYKFNNEFVYDGTELMSRGSGFYVGIKRRIQIYPKKTNIKSS